MSYLLQTQFNLSSNPDLISEMPTFMADWLQQGHTVDSIKCLNEQYDFLRVLESPCEDIPITGLGFQHFYAVNPSYDNILNIIETTLSSRNFHCLVYNEVLKEFIITQRLPSGYVRQDTVSVFWDRCRKDHVIEVRKTMGEATFLSETEKLHYINVYSIIHMAFTGLSPISVRERVLSTIRQDILANNRSGSPTGVANLAYSPITANIAQR